jgi:hypothetical protein
LSCNKNNIKLLFMKKQILLAAFLVVSLAVNAKIWRVNNDATKDPDVAQASVLFDGTNNAGNPEAANGDTIHIEPSATVYPGFTVNKQVVIIGNGYLLANNAGLQANNNNSEANGIIFAVGSENSIISGVASIGFQLTNVGNITITRCRIGNLVFASFSVVKTGIVITKNFITGTVTNSGFTGAGDATVTFENNIFSSLTGNAGTSINLSNLCRGLFRNNVCGGAITNIIVSNFYFTNNIMISNGNTAVLGGSNNVIKNNLNNRGAAVSGGLPAGNGNQNITDVQMRGTTSVLGDVFAGDVFNTTSTTPGDARFELRIGGPNTNPAIATGETIAPVNTPDLGVYGATDPYKKSGIPALPTIYGLTVPASVPPTATNMNVTISTRSNN